MRGFLGKDLLKKGSGRGEGCVIFYKRPYRKKMPMTGPENGSILVWELSPLTEVEMLHRVLMVLFLRQLGRSPVGISQVFVLGTGPESGDLLFF